MALQYQYYAVDQSNLVATYSGDGLERPYQYKIKLIPKNGYADDNMDFELTEMNTEIHVKVSKRSLVEAIAKEKTNDDVANALFGHPRNFYDTSKSSLDRYTDFAIANMQYFMKLMKQYNLSHEDVQNAHKCLLIDIRWQFAELLRSVYADMLVQNYDASKK